MDLTGVLPGYRVHEGGMATVDAGTRSHPEGRHVHGTPEIFAILAGAGAMEIDGEPTPVGAGDVLVVEAGEDHHLVADAGPLVTLWLHLEPANR
jgi:mannose-6-phosphate isomerase-like protein (cupin superfamily)